MAVLQSREHLLQLVMHTALMIYQTVSHNDWKTAVELHILKKGRPAASHLSVLLDWDEKVC